MNYSRRQLEFLGEPLGDACTRMEGGKRIYGGGGGGQAYRDATPEERALWAAQAQSLQMMNQIAMPNLLTGMNNLGTMANESMDGTLAERLRGMAGADASAAMGQGITGAQQHLERYGATLNPNALAAQTNAMALQGAADKANAMNQANFAAEDVKWQRNAALAGLASGQGAQSVSGMGALANSIAQNRYNAQNSQNQQTQGLGMMGAYLGSRLFADGGMVHAPHFANGGGLQLFQRHSMPTVNPMQFGNSSESYAPSTMQTLGAIGAPIAMQAATNVAKKALSDMGVTKGLENIGTSLANGAKNMLGLGGKEVPAGMAGQRVAVGSMEGLAGEGAGAALEEGAGAALGEGAGAALGEGAGAALGEGAATALGEGAGMLAPVATGAELAGSAATLGAANAWNPVGWGLLAAAAASALMNRADGGPIGLRRPDGTSGGAVRGPGSEVSDSIPAWLSNNEYVVNAEAMKDPEDAATVKRINAKGLRRRKRSGKANPKPQPDGRALGGVWRQAAQGPGVLTLHAAGQDTDNLSTAQKIASLLGDPIGTRFFAQGGAVGLGGKHGR